MAGLAYRSPSALGLLAATAILVVSGCASQEPTQTGFLRDYSELRPTAAHPDNPSYRKPGRMADYAGFIVDEVVYRPTTEAAEPPDAESRAELTAEYRSRLISAFSEKYRQAEGPGPGVMRIRAAVTDVAAASPILNAITMAAVVVPVTAGGASTEAEVVDSMTGERLVAYQGFNNGGRSFLGGPLGFLSVYGQARRAFTIQAEELRDLLDDGRPASGADLEPERRLSIEKAELFHTDEPRAGCMPLQPVLASGGGT